MTCFPAHMTARMTARALAATLVAVLVVTFTSVGRSAAAFWAATATTGNAFAAGTGFGTGALTEWGDAGDLLPVPTQIVAGASWTTITAGNHYNCGIQTDQSLWCFGQSNSNSQQGVNDTASHYLPVKVGTGTWSQVATGSAHTCGIQTDTTLYCWGSNADGRTGQNLTTGNSTTPKPMTTPAATGWATVTTGSSHTCATRTDGTLYCWGLNSSGQLGIGSVTSAALPAQVTAAPGPAGWSSVTAGNSHTCALRADQSLYCWGDGNYYKLAQGTSTTDQTSPVLVSGTYTSVSAGYDHTCGIRSPGTLFCWGYGNSGRLGSGGTTSLSTPTAVSGGATNWRSVSGASGYTCATRTDGTLWCWGLNTYAQLGLNDLATRTVPAQVGTDTTWAYLAQGSNPMQTCATRTDGTVWCQGDPGVVRYTPKAVGSDTTWRSLAVGDNFTCGTQSGGSLWCWGLNTNGRLGVGDANPRFLMTRVGALNTWKQVSAGLQHACGVTTDTTLYCWGANSVGQIGIGTSSASVPNPAQVTTPAATGWTAVATGRQFTCATRNDGTLYCWGDNVYGQLGQGTVGGAGAFVTSPVQVTVAPGPAGWAQPLGGWYHSCALRTDRTLYCWGEGGNGRLGTNSLTTTGTPGLVSGGAWAQVSVGQAHGCAVKSTGTLWCWGYGNSGRLGLGTSTDQRVPVQVGTLSTWRYATAGSAHTCAVPATNTVLCWGSNAIGQLGLGSAVTTQTTPAQVPGVTGRPVVGGASSGAVALLVPNP